MPHAPLPWSRELCWTSTQPHPRRSPRAARAAVSPQVSLSRLSLLLFDKCFLGNSCVFPQTLGQEEGSRHSRVSRRSQGPQTGDRRGHSSGPGPGHHRSEWPRVPDPRQAGQTIRLETDFALDPPRPQTLWIHTGVSSEKCQPVAIHSPGRQPPQGQFQGRNCSGLGAGSENKHSGFYRFTRVGCCFPLQQLLNQAFHSEASGL